MFKALRSYCGMLPNDLFSASIDDNTGNIKITPRKESIRPRIEVRSDFEECSKINTFEVVSFWYKNHPLQEKLNKVETEISTLKKSTLEKNRAASKYRKMSIAYYDIFNNGGGNADADIERYFGLRFFDEAGDHLPDGASKLEAWELIQACDPALEVALVDAFNELFPEAPEVEPVRDIELLMQDAFLDVLGYNPGHKVDMEHLMQEVVTCNFRDLTEMYDRAIKLTVETTKEPNENYDLFGRLNNLSRAIKAVMFVRFPDGARDWFDGDLH